MTGYLALNEQLAAEAVPGNDGTHEAFNVSGSNRVFDVPVLTQELTQRLDTGSTMFDDDFAPAMRSRSSSHRSERPSDQCRGVVGRSRERA